MNNSTILLNDLESVIYDNAIPWETLQNSNVLITGATGMIGRGCVNVLGLLNKACGYNIKIYALGRNLEKGKELAQISGVQFMQADIKNALEIEGAIDYIIHCAAVTKSSEMLSNPVGVIETELSGSKNMLEFARAKNCKSFLYTSSMESYGLLDLSDVTETDQGYIDLTNPRSSYPMCKRMTESLCNCYWSQYHLQTNIVRLGMVFGAGEEFANDNRVWAQFAQRVFKQEPIILHTEGKSLRSFTYLSDALKGIFLVLLLSPGGETYNIATHSCEIRAFAENLADKYELKVEITPPKNIAQLGYAKEYKLPLNSEKIKALGWKPQIARVEDMVARVIEHRHEHKK
jgi:Nucleoside-diphosphate-sugar epimerases